MKKPNTLSLQEQLLKSGLSTEGKARQINTEKRKQQNRERNNGERVVDEVKLSAEQLRQQQIERDRELNRQRQEVEQQKALQAQIRQLVTLNSLALDSNGVSYQFDHLGKVKRIEVSAGLRDALINGKVAVVWVDDTYHAVPAEIARRIQQRDAERVVVLYQPDQQAASIEAKDDPYAAFQIPDDLIW